MTAVRKTRQEVKLRPEAPKVAHEQFTVPAPASNENKGKKGNLRHVKTCTP